jgi:ribosomal protein S18 acetylase RimI-like enzyme
MHDDMEALERIVGTLFPKSNFTFGANELYFLATQRKSIIGFSHLRILGHGQRGVVAGLGVLPPYRKRGIGTLLLQAALAYFEEIGCMEIVLKVKPENLATEIYAKHGFAVRKAGPQSLLLCKAENS